MFYLVPKCRSVPQIALVVIRTIASAGSPIAGSGTSSTDTLPDDSLHLRAPPVDFSPPRRVMGSRRRRPGIRRYASLVLRGRGRRMHHCPFGIVKVFFLPNGRRCFATGAWLPAPRLGPWIAEAPQRGKRDYPDRSAARLPPDRRARHRGRPAHGRPHRHRRHGRLVLPGALRRPEPVRCPPG